MPSLDSPLLFAVLAFHRKFISKEQLLEATAAWMTSPEIDLGRLLLDGKYIVPEQHDAIQQLMDDWSRSHSTAPGPTPEMSKELRDTLVQLRRARQVPAPEPAPRAGQKYDLGTELGRGGIGRVVEAVDRELGRKVALKLMLEDAPQDLQERFRWEAKITGRLEHPNVVPVHELGVMPGSREVFMCMKRIYGKDMSDAIRDGKRGLRGLVEAFRDVCRAIAYAHSMGVLHRDIKPANVMMGDFGEVLVVDWGLARLVGEEDRPSQFKRATSSRLRAMPKPIATKEETKNLTLEGDILGTPSYMPPEQAMGWLHQIDERSDVYSLGATLYEILTFRPPFDGETSQDILDKVVGLPLTRPSQLRPCPPELEMICLKAMAYQQAQRYPNVKALQGDIEAWLAGTMERERRERMVGEQLERAQKSIDRWKRLGAEARGAAAKATEEAGKFAGHEPPEAHRQQWALEDQAAGLERGSIDALTEANAAIASALSLVPHHPEARRMKAELFWDQFLEAEADGERRTMLQMRRTAEEFNDGPLGARLRGDGTLAVRPREYRCACLREGRVVSPSDLNVLGWHPWSGRRRDGIETDCLPALEPAEPVRLRVHASSCRTEEFAGAEAWAFRYEEIDRLLVPVTPAGAASGSPIPPAVLDALFGDSPGRPRGKGLPLGRAPVQKCPWPMGSWLLVLAAPGKAPRRIPFIVGRQQDVVLDPVLYAPEEVPPGHVVISGGTFTSETDSGDPADLFREEVTIDDFFLARHPFTCREYGEFLNSLRIRDPKEAALHVPRQARNAGWYWPLTSRGYVVPATAWLASAPAEEKARAGRLETSPVDWEEDWPVLAVSWEDAQLWARESSRAGSWLRRLPTMHEWERAARGADRRTFPWGNLALGALANWNLSHAAGARPVSVQAFPTDESPWGVRGMGGNSHDRCLNDAGANYRRWRAVRGGAWSRTQQVARISHHAGTTIPAVSYTTGFRGAASVKLTDIR